MRRGPLIVGTLIVALFSACGGASSSGRPVGLSQPDPSASPALPHSVVASVDVGSEPCAVEGGFGSIWVSLYAENREVRLDPSTHRVIARIPTRRAPCGVAVGGGSVWVEDFGGNAVTRIDPRTNKVAATVAVGSAPYDVTYLAGAAWVTNYSDNTVSRIDAATDRATTIKVGDQPTGIAPAGGAIWVTNKADGTISRIDPSTLAVRTTKLGSSPAWTAWGDGRLWVSDTGRIDRVDLRTGRSDRTVTAGGQPNDGDIVGGKVWVTDTSGTLHEIDAASGRPIGAWPLGLTDPFVLAGYAGKLWVVDFKGTQLDEIDPSTLS